MQYQITRVKGGVVEGIETWKGGPFEAVKEHARELVEIGLADRVEVRDGEQNLVFHYPRVTRPVKPSA